MASQGYQVKEEGADEQRFSCNFCEYKHKKEGTIKGHVTKKHKDKNTPGEGVTEAEVLDDNIEEDMRLMAEWNRPAADTEDLVDPENPGDGNVEEVVVINEAIGQEGNLGQAVGRIKVLEEDIGVNEELIKKMETELETAREMASIAVAKEASLEDKKATMKHHLDYFRRVSKTQFEEIKKMKAGTTNPEGERKLKEAESKIKNNTKTIEGLEKAKKELIKKVEDEVSARAKAEADAAKFSKMVDILQECEGRRKETMEKSKDKCRDVGRPGGCPRAGSCKYLHPALVKENKNVDCHHWMNGKCRYSDNDCRFKQDPTKKDSKISKRKRSEESAPEKDTSQQDFILGLVKALAQGNGLGGQGGPSRGLEGQRDSRPRMEIPNSSSRGMDGHQWRQQSYASATSSPGRAWGQEEQEWSRSSGRQEHPSRGTDGLEGLRGMVHQGTKSAHETDTMQEGIRLLMQLAAQQQAGRQ